MVPFSTPVSESIGAQIMCSWPISGLFGLPLHADMIDLKYQIWIKCPTPATTNIHVKTQNPTSLL